MASTVFHSNIQSGGRRKTAKGNVRLSLVGSFDPTSASQVSLFTLPAGSRPLDVISYGGATGGTNPTVDVGTADDDGLANELDADAVSSAVADGTGGALLGTVLADDTEIFGKVGASAATGGTTTVVVEYIRE